MTQLELFHHPLQKATLRDGSVEAVIRESCDNCGGTGKRRWSPCVTCWGSGHRLVSVVVRGGLK